MFLHVNDKNDRQVGNDGLIYVGSASVVFHPVWPLARFSISC
jgi:hypothetical protein